jgi:hypothetical protein
LKTATDVTKQEGYMGIKIPINLQIIKMHNKTIENKVTKYTRVASGPFNTHNQSSILTTCTDTSALFGKS